MVEGALESSIMSRQVLAMALAIATGSICLGQCPPLSTPFGSNLGQAGNMFDLTNSSPVPIAITSLDVNLLPGTWDVEIYTRSSPVSWSGAQGVPSAWNLAGSANGVLSLGLDQATPVPAIFNVFIPPSGVRGFYVTVTSGVGMRYTTGSSLGAPLASDGSLTILAGSSNVYPFGTSFTPRNWNGGVHYSLGGAAQYQQNSPEAHLDADGVSGSACAAARLTLCSGSPFAINVQSSLAAAPFELILSTAPLLPLFGGGTYAATEIVNLDLSQALFFFNGVSAPVYQPFPGNISAIASPAAPSMLSSQGLWLHPSSPPGFRFSQGSQVEMVPTSGITSLNGPVNNDESLNIDVTALPHCWCNSVPFYGSNYTSFSVESNGRLVFGNGDSDFSPTLSEAVNDSPFVGYWTDLNPAQGGSITVSTPVLGSNIIRVDYQSVPYFNLPGTPISFGIQIDCINGDVLLDGLVGITANPSSGSTGDNQFLGLSPGAGGATDPGTAAFALGGSGSATAASDMLYDFASGLTGAPVALTSLIPGTLGAIHFAPDGAGNYLWTGL